MLKFIAVGDRVLVRVDKAKEKTVSGIIIPDAAAEVPTTGEVLSVGDDDDLQGMPISVGDRIVFGQYAGVDVDVNGESLKVIRKDDIMLVSA